MLSTCSWWAAHIPLLGHPSPSCCTNWLLTAHSCTLPRFSDLPAASWTAQLETPGKFCTTPSWEERQPPNWLIHSYQSPACFPQNGTTICTRRPPVGSGWGETTKPTWQSLSCLFLPYTPSLILLQISSVSKSLNICCSRITTSDFTSRACDLWDTLGCDLLREPCYRTRVKNSPWSVKGGLRCTFRLLLVRIWENLQFFFNYFIFQMINQKLPGLS